MRATQEVNGWLLRAIAIGACGLVVMMLAAFLAFIHTNTQSNAIKLIEIETRLLGIERDIAEMANEQRNSD